MSKEPKGDPVMQLRAERRRLLSLLRAVGQAKRDPRLARRPAHYERFRTILGKIRNIELLLLKGHILLEEAIFEILASVAVNRLELEELQLQFSTKRRLARAFGLIASGPFDDQDQKQNRHAA